MTTILQFGKVLDLLEALFYKIMKMFRLGLINGK